jgi:hypothetical protein
VDSLAERIPATLLQEWMAYLRIEPQGADVDDWRWSALLTMIANQNRSKKRGPVRQKKFALMRDERASDIFQRLKSWALGQGANRR